MIIKDYELTTLFAFVGTLSRLFTSGWHLLSPPHTSTKVWFLSSGQVPSIVK